MTFAIILPNPLCLISMYAHETLLLYVQIGTLMCNTVISVCTLSTPGCFHIIGNSLYWYFSSSKTFASVSNILKNPKTSTHSCKTSFQFSGRTSTTPKKKQNLWICHSKCKKKSFNSCINPNITNKKPTCHMLILFFAHPCVFVFLVQEGRRGEHAAEVRSHDAMSAQCVFAHWNTRGVQLFAIQRGFNRRAATMLMKWDGK